jgi:hypothetical protein
MFKLDISCLYSIANYNDVRGAGEVYSIQHYVIKFVSDLRKVGGLV